MMYAGARELMRNTAEANRVVEVQSDEDVTSIAEKLGGSDWRIFLNHQKKKKGKTEVCLHISCDIIYVCIWRG